jgi:hypothetical protein
MDMDPLIRETICLSVGICYANNDFIGGLGKENGFSEALLKELFSRLGDGLFI